ncbi:ORF6N domain-containing protein [Hydrobacter penzbergensis]|uniref:ORF6N domain-containing protein n=1 Tax=Hydrobacter penzbergensis TaxID=1235997 RepID=A0A8X8ICY1_9BACT|nr:ORF6N domain-containing protein [Hydrobacter penzbergensis]SDX02879.1 ORF6N domain-containing protein [Hydrobacter penzbergensis]
MNLISIQQRIFEVRGHKVMLDFDLAALYEVETKVFNQSIKRNVDNFPDDFMFRLTSQEWDEITIQLDHSPGDPDTNRSQIVTGSQKHRSSAFLPYAFTEHGVTMLASVLKSPKARKMNIAIVRAFIALRKFALDHRGITEQLRDLQQKISEHDVQLSQIYDAIENLLDQKAEEKKWQDRERIGFKK